MRHHAGLLSGLLMLLLITGCRTPGNGLAACPCTANDDREIAALFELWNAALQTGDARQVGARYADDAILLPTLSKRVRLTPAEREDYFVHFLADRPSGVVTQRRITRAGDTAVDSGLYTFTFAKTGQVVAARYTFAYRQQGSRWLITHHHSSALPAH